MLEQLDNEGLSILKSLLSQIVSNIFYFLD